MFNAAKEVKMTDPEISEQARLQMLAKEFDPAIASVRQIQNKQVALKMELIIIEYARFLKLQELL
jgi:hypothetical protein